MTSTPRPSNGDSTEGDRLGEAVVKLVATVLGLVASVVGALVALVPSLSLYRTIVISLAVASVLIIVLLCLAFKYPDKLKAFLRRAERLLRKWNPWLMAVGLSLSAPTFILALAIYHALPVRSDICEVPLFGSSGDLYNSCSKQSDGHCYIEALAPEKNKDGIAAFNIQLDPTGSRTNTKNNNAPHSSGWYIPFWGSPCNRMEYRSFRFSWRASCKLSEPDFGVRLVVDNANPRDPKELVVYEKSGVRQLSTKEGDWFNVALDTRDIKEKSTVAGVERNRINKVVFFVEPDTADLCGGGTFAFRDVRFVQNAH